MQPRSAPIDPDTSRLPAEKKEARIAELLTADGYVVTEKMEVPYLIAGFVVGCLSSYLLTVFPGKLTAYEAIAFVLLGAGLPLFVALLLVHRLLRKRYFGPVLESWWRVRFQGNGSNPNGERWCLIVNAASSFVGFWIIGGVAFLAVLQK